MPIPGLLSQDRMTFPKVGDIRKGAKKTEANKPGLDLTFFRYVPIEGEEGAAVKFHEVYGDEPREVNIFLPFDEIARNFETFMERHTASALQCRGSIEGSVCYMWRDDDGKMHHEQKACPMPICKGCKETGRLKIIIPELRRLAYVTVHTTSKWDIIELMANLGALRKLTGNGLKGIPLVLKRRPRTISTPRKNGNRVRQEKWLLSIEADERWVDAQLKAMEAAALPEGARLALPEPELKPPEVDLDTGEIVGVYEDPDEPAEEPESPIKLDPLAIAKAYTTDSGRPLSKFTPDELQSMLEKINDLKNPKAKMLILKGHIEAILDHVHGSQQEELPL